MVIWICSWLWNMLMPPTSSSLHSTKLVPKSLLLALFLYLYKWMRQRIALRISVKTTIAYGGHFTCMYPVLTGFFGTYVFLMGTSAEFQKFHLLIFMFGWSHFICLSSSWTFCEIIDCEWKTQAGNICAASFDWTCSGICNSVDRMKEVHQRCGESENAPFEAVF